MCSTGLCKRARCVESAAARRLHRRTRAPNRWVSSYYTFSHSLAARLRRRRRQRRRRRHTAAFADRCCFEVCDDAATQPRRRRSFQPFKPRRLRWRRTHVHTHTHTLHKRAVRTRKQPHWHVAVVGSGRYYFYGNFKCRLQEQTFCCSRCSIAPRNGSIGLARRRCERSRPAECINSEISRTVRAGRHPPSAVRGRLMMLSIRPSVSIDYYALSAEWVLRRTIAPFARKCLRTMLSF